MNELNEHGLLIFKHSSNKNIMLFRSYKWVDRILLINKKTNEYIMGFKYSTFDLTEWTPITKEEYDKLGGYE